jgi:hypothetical protein
LGGLAGTGFAIFGDFKGGWDGPVFIGLAVGALLALPVMACSVVDSLVRTSWKKVALGLPLLFLLSFCFPYYGGPVLFLQLCAILVPSIIVRGPWKNLLLGVASGLAFLGVWYLLWLNRVAPIAMSDDIFVFYPFAIALVSIDAAGAKAIGKRLGILPPATCPT